MFKSEPVTGQAYPVDGTTGTPLGGFGAGAVKFCAHQGSFAAVTQAPADQNDYESMGQTRLQFYSSRDGCTEQVDTMKAVMIDGRSDDDAAWPLHRVNFGKVNNIGIRMVAFSPLHRTNVKLMSMPYAFYELELRNEGPSEAIAACAFLVELEGAAASVPGRGLASAKWAVCGSSDDSEAVITNGSHDSLFLGAGEGTDSSGHAAGSTAVKVVLAPGESKRIRFVLAWYDNRDPDRAYYLGMTSNPAEIAELGMESFNLLKANAEELVDRLRQSNLPDWLKNQTLTTLVSLSNNSLFKKDGRVAFAEGEWTCFGTMDQMWHARQIVNHLAPFYAWQELQYWARTQKDNGQIHHDFNAAGPDKSVLVEWDDWNHPDYREISKWVDLNCGFIISVYETYRATGDEEQLDYFWPFIKKAGLRILEQVKLYGSREYPYTFDESENSYDAGGDPNPFNASLSAVAYRIMVKLAEKREDSSLSGLYQKAYDTVTASYRARYLKDFPTGRGCESYFAGQWLSLHLKLGEIWTDAETDRVLEGLDSYYHPYYWGLGNLKGTYNEWTPYLLTHYGGLLLNTRRANQWLPMQQDAYNRQFSNRSHVFNHPLDILPAVKEPDYLSTVISGDKQYISMPGIWRNYYDIVGFDRDRSTGELWLKPIMLDEMEHEMKNAMFITAEGYGSISCRESGEHGQNKDITLKADHPIEVSIIHLADHYGREVNVVINGQPCSYTRSGTGYAKELLIVWNRTVGDDGLQVMVTGDPGPAGPALPPKPNTGADGAKPSAIRHAYEYMEAESADEMAGVSLVTPVGGTWYVTDCHNFDYIKLDHVDFGEVGSQTFIAIAASAVSGSRMEIVLDRVSGEVIGNCPVPDTGGAEAWKVLTCPIKWTTGVHDVILRFFGDGETSLVNIDKFKFLQNDGRLDRTGWSAHASRNGLNGPNVLDGDQETVWRVTCQEQLLHLTVDMKEERTINCITLDRLPGDTPGDYELFVSSNGTEFGEAVAAGRGTVEHERTTIGFPEQKARFARLTLTGPQGSCWAVKDWNAWLLEHPSQMD